MPKVLVTRLIRLALAVAFTIGFAERAAASSILLSNLQIEFDETGLIASISAGFEAQSGDGSDIFLDSLAVSLDQDGVFIPDLFAGPTQLDPLPFFSLPFSLSDGGILPNLYAAVPHHGAGRRRDLHGILRAVPVWSGCLTRGPGVRVHDRAGARTRHADPDRVRGSRAAAAARENADPSPLITQHQPLIVSSIVWSQAEPCLSPRRIARPFNPGVSFAHL